MKKVGSLLLVLVLLLLAGCTGQTDELESSPPQNDATADESETSSVENDETDALRAVVVYFSLTENTEEVALEIQEQTQAEIIQLETVVPYSRVYSEVQGLVREQQEDGIFPELVDTGIHAEDYDLIFVGSPTWHGYISQPVQKWLMDNDFEGKRIAPFFTSGSQPIVDPQSDLRELVPNATILTELSMAGSPREDISESVEEWLTSIGFE